MTDRVSPLDATFVELEEADPSAHMHTMPGAPVFRSILCGTDNGPVGTAARRQAKWLAGADGVVEMVPTRALTRCSSEVLAERCGPHDLLVVGHEYETRSVLLHAHIPVLIARWCPGYVDVTDEILVAVCDLTGAERAARLAGRLARRYRAPISLVGAGARSHELECALASSERRLRAAGAFPAVVSASAYARPEHAVQAAAAELGASLLVVGSSDAAVTDDITRLAGCSVLAIAAPVRSVLLTDRFAGAAPMRPREHLATIVT